MRQLELLFAEHGIAERLLETGDLCVHYEVIAYTEAGKPQYCYGEKMRLIELRCDGRWIAEIDMGIVRGYPWHKNGMRLIVENENLSEVLND